MDNIVYDMKITKLTLDSPPSNFEIIGTNISNENYSNKIIFKYIINNKINYKIREIEHKHLQIFYEISNNSPLWTYSFEIKKNNVVGKEPYSVYLTICLEHDLINEFIGSSVALNKEISSKFNSSPTFTGEDFNDKSIVSFCDPVKPPKNFKVQLYEYQQRTLAKMLSIEKNQGLQTINYNYTVKFGSNDILFDPVTNSKTNKSLKFNIKTCGGILADEMGLGKTISSIALIASHPAPVDMPDMSPSKLGDINKISSRATLVVCPSHLTKQWENEIIKCYPYFKIKTILTKTDYNGLTFRDFIESDIIITSHSFIMNFKFYPTLHYQYCTPASYNFNHRNNIVKSYIQDKVTKVGFPAIKDLTEPIFEFFHFHRLILDEGHEIFGEMLSSPVLSRYMSQWVSNIDAKYFWYVSGTPFINYIGVKNCAKFIQLKLEDPERNIIFDWIKDYDYDGYNLNDDFILFIKKFINKEYIWNNILERICVRHKKVDVENQIQIPGYIEKLVWVKFTELERQLYEAKKNKTSEQYLQQLCCHPLIVESSKKIFGDVEVDLSLMQDKLIDYHRKNHESYSLKLSKLDPLNPAYHMHKKSFETQMAESKYMFTILEKMKTTELVEEENCSICMDTLDNPTLTNCGHLFCYDCLKMCLGDKKRCPMCKTDLTGKELLITNPKIKTEEEINPLIKKYGSKLGKLISIIRFLVAQEDTRIIVFSQWDDMLSLVGKTLAENGIENCFVKGNVWSRNSAIKKFKAGKNDKGVDNKVIMLSLKNAASGTNLTEATHIFFVEPISASKEECKAIEGQAIARALRIGQKQEVMLMRILIEKTIEEEIYRKNYNENVQVSFEETSYMIQPTKPKIANPDNDGELEDESETQQSIEAQIKPKRVIKNKATNNETKPKRISKKKVIETKEIEL